MAKKKKEHVSRRRCLATCSHGVSKPCKECLLVCYLASLAAERTGNEVRSCEHNKEVGFNNSVIVTFHNAQDDAARKQFTAILSDISGTNFEIDRDEFMGIKIFVTIQVTW